MLLGRWQTDTQTHRHRHAGLQAGRPSRACFCCCCFCLRPRRASAECRAQQKRLIGDGERRRGQSAGRPDQAGQGQGQGQGPGQGQGLCRCFNSEGRTGRRRVSCLWLVQPASQSQRQPAESRPSRLECGGDGANHWTAALACCCCRLPVCTLHSALCTDCDCWLLQDMQCVPASALCTQQRPAAALHCRPRAGWMAGGDGGSPSTVPDVCAAMLPLLRPGWRDRRATAEVVRASRMRESTSTSSPSRSPASPPR